MSVTLQNGVRVRLRVKPGIPGKRGAPGASLTPKGSLDNISDLPMDAAVGDVWIIEGDGWAWDGLQWNNTGPWQGPAGDSWRPDATGPLSGRSAYNSMPVPFSYLAEDNGMVYFRQGAVGGWSQGQAFPGAGLATKPEAQAGLRNDLLMTPETTHEAVPAVKMDLGVQAPAYTRTLAEILQSTTLPVELFGVVKNAATDQSGGMNNVISHLNEQYLKAAYNTDLKQVDYAVDLGAGIIRLHNPVDAIPFGVTFAGRGMAHAKFECHGAFTAISTQEFESNGTTRRYHNGMRMRGFSVLSMDPDNRTTGFRLRNLIRNSSLEDVGHIGCVVGYDVDWSWTLAFRDCFGLGGSTGQPITSRTQNHFVLGGDTGGIVISGGRYDIASGFHLDAVGNDKLELMVTNDAAFQFGSSGAIRTGNARSVIIESGFFEGNCIGNTTNYYLELGGANNSLCTCRVKDVVMNNLADNNRNGLGVAYIDGFRDITYHHRWTRNGVKRTPVFGPSNFRAQINLPTSDDMPSADLQYLSGANAASAVAEIHRPARPLEIIGKPMTGTMSETGALLAGSRSYPAVLLGNRVDEAVVQSALGNVGSDIAINPFGGMVRLPAVRRFMTFTSSTIAPSKTQGLVALHMDDGGANIRLDQLTFDPPVGYELVVIKYGASYSVSIVPPLPTDTINAVAGTKNVSAAGRYVLVKVDTTRWHLSFSPDP